MSVTQLKEEVPSQLIAVEGGDSRSAKSGHVLCVEDPGLSGAREAAEAMMPAERVRLERKSTAPYDRPFQNLTKERKCWISFLKKSIGNCAGAFLWK